MTVRLNVPTFEYVHCVPMHVSIWGYKLGGVGGAEGRGRRIKDQEGTGFLDAFVSVTRFGLTTPHFDPS